MKNYCLTIDVGTKNLAICICSYSNSNLEILKRINIIDWSVLDVSYKPLYCKHIKNKRSICNCISKYYSIKPEINDNDDAHLNPDNLIGYCKNHAKITRDLNKKNKNILYNII